MRQIARNYGFGFFAIAYLLLSMEKQQTYGAMQTCHNRDGNSEQDGSMLKRDERSLNSGGQAALPTHPPPVDNGSMPTEIQSACHELESFNALNATVTSAVLTPPGAFKIPSPTNPPAVTNLPPFCRVQGILLPTSDSRIKFEVWMPVFGWNGRFVQVGNGGYAGEIEYALMGPALQRGYATASTDDGHVGNLNADWMIGHPEKVIDFGYRAVHETNEAARGIIQTFYVKPIAYSYFNGCSDGGREALMEAQRFPSDFNGIIAGAPANFWTHLAVGWVWNEQAMLDTPAGFIPASKLAAIQAAALRACDAIDGVKDGILENPIHCHFDPSVLQCNGVDGPDCLTLAQVESTKKVYAGPANPRTKARIFPGYEPGAEADPLGWAEWITGHRNSGGGQAYLGNLFFSRMVFADPKWDFHALNFDKDVEIADAKLAHILNSTDPDLLRFKSRGGKLIQYHGWADAAIAPLNSINYYRTVINKMGGLENTRSFYRLFMAPGMAHCAGGPGPNSFGGEYQELLPQADAEYDLLSALVQWVEYGAAPETLIATKFVNDDPAKGVLMTRPLCPYPQEAEWTGKGDTSQAVNFACKVFKNHRRRASHTGH